MHHYVYCIENLVNGKVYVGKHSTEDLDDGYMGSGKLVARAIAKHGLENFRKHVLQEFETSEEAFEFEKLLVTEEFVSDENTYNLTCGGSGSWAIVNLNVEFRKEKNKRAAQAMNTALWQDPNFRLRHTKICSELMKRLLAEGKIKKCDWAGRKHRPETREKMKASHVGKHDGEKNSQFGTCWVTHPELKKSQRVNKGELETYIQLGWTKGRKLKW